MTARGQVRPLAPLLGVLALGAILRAAALPHVPLIVTADGNGYYGAAIGLFRFVEQAWFNPWRTPGYPLFLEGVVQACGDTPACFLRAQALLGLLAVVVYYRLGCRVGSRLVGLGLALFLAASPAMITMEHSLLSESLAVVGRGVTLLAAAAVMAARGRRRLGLGLATGLVLAMQVLIRPSELLLLPAVLSVFALTWWRERHGHPDESRWQLPVAAALVLAACATLLSPWFGYNTLRHGRFALTGNTNISRLVFAIREGVLPVTAPAIQGLAPQLADHCRYDREGCGWDVVRALRRGGGDDYQVDRLAGSIVDAQVRATPWRYAGAVARVGLEQVGVVPGRWTELDFFVTRLALDPAAYRNTMQSATPPWAAEASRTAVRAPIWFLRGFQGLSLVLFRFRHPALWVLFAIGLWRCRTPERWLLAAVVIVFTASLSFLLAPVDRYMLLNEPLQLALGLAAMADVLGGGSGRRGAWTAFREAGRPSDSTAARP